MIFSFGVIYWNSQLSDIGDSTKCEGASYTTSADGFVVIDEADLRCAGDVERKRSSLESINLISISVGVVSTGLTLFLLFLLLKNHISQN